MKLSGFIEGMGQMGLAKDCFGKIEKRKFSNFGQPCISNTVVSVAIAGAGAGHLPYVQGFSYSVKS